MIPIIEHDFSNQIWYNKPIVIKNIARKILYIFMKFKKR